MASFGTTQNDVIYSPSDGDEDEISDGSSNVDDLDNVSEESGASDLEGVDSQRASILNGIVLRHETRDNDESSRAETEETDAIVRDGLLQIRKLDRHLKRLSKMELETKRSRLRFEAQMVREFEQLTAEYPNSANNCPSVQANTQKYLAIEVPFEQTQKGLPRADGECEDNSSEENSEISANESEEELEVIDDDDDNVVPVFQTELNDVTFSRKKAVPSSHAESSHVNTSRSSSSEYITARSSASDDNNNYAEKSKSNGSTKSPSLAGSHNSSLKPKEAFVSKKEVRRQTKVKKKNEGKNFVARNIQLAMDAASNVPMTDDEKKRLSELLADIDEEDNSEQTNTDQAESELALVVRGDGAVVSSRNSIISSAATEGYRPADDEIERLTAIDNKLRALCAPPSTSSHTNSYRNGSVAGTVDTWRDSVATHNSLRLLPLSRIHNNSSRSQDAKSDETALALIMEDIPSSSRSSVDLGEQALVEVRETRMLNTRLETIDEQLADLTGSHPYPTEVDLPRLAPSEVRSLVGQCMSVLSGRDTDDGESSNLSYEDVLSTASRLPESTLRNLLDQAKRELGLVSLDAPQQNFDVRGNLSDRFTPLYDNETWTFLREVEANLEYPPAFLRSLPDSAEPQQLASTSDCSLTSTSTDAADARIIKGPQRSNSQLSSTSTLPPLTSALGDRRRSFVKTQSTGGRHSAEIKKSSSASLSERDAERILSSRSSESSFHN